MAKLFHKFFSYLYYYGNQAIGTILAAKLRSFLAVLGVLVGTIAVVALMTCGELATEQALVQFKKLGTNLLAISAYPSGQGELKSHQDELPLSFWQSLPKMMPNIKAIAPYGTTYQPLSFAGTSLSGSIIGANEELAPIIKIKMLKGHFVHSIEAYDHICVLGHGLLKQVQKVTLQSPLGQQIRMGQSLCTVVGTIEPWQENGFFNEDINQSIIVPLPSLMFISRDAKINNAILLLKENTDIDEVIHYLRQRISEEAPGMSVFIRSAKQIIASMENQGRIFTLLLGVIGGIALFVGGIGIMNIMLVSVSERKKEIGIRKAVGAREKDIQALFLIESVILSLLGGTLGVMLGLLLTRVVAYFTHWDFKIIFFPVFSGFLVSSLTGIFFGFYPAKRAAAMEPIQSLRGE